MTELPPKIREDYRVATPREIYSWSFGLLAEVRSPDRPTRGSLDDQAIFGPKQDFNCTCGKYSGNKYRGMICDRCGVKVTTSDERQWRFAHIDLPFDVEHPFGIKQEILAIVPVLPARFIEALSDQGLAAAYERTVQLVARGDPREISLSVRNLFDVVAAQLVEAHNAISPITYTWARGIAFHLVVHPDGRCNRCGYPVAGLEGTVCPGCGTQLENEREGS